MIVISVSLAGSVGDAVRAGPCSQYIIYAYGVDQALSTTTVSGNDGRAGSRRTEDLYLRLSGERPRNQ